LPFAKRFVVCAPAPAKLATDIIAAIVSLYFFWQDDIVIGSRRTSSRRPSRGPP
jgi:hypothetical protein